MSGINLLYVITKLELGGAQKQLLNLINYLNKQKYNLSLITARDGLLIKDVLSIKDLRLIKSRFLERSINPIWDFFALCEIYTFIKSNKIDIVHTHSSKAGILGRWAARLARVRVIVHTVHGWSFHEYQNRLWRRIIIWLEKLTARVTDKLIVVSYYDWQKGLDNRISNTDKYRIIRYGIEYREFILPDKSIQQDRTKYQTQLNKKDKDFRKELGIDASDLVIGMVSCLKPQKSPQDFVRLAFLVNKTITKIKFLLVGNGILRKRIERLISKLNLGHKVILTGWREDIPQILSVIDIFVLTSLWEGLPISVLEAMAASLPVVATNTGGIAEIILAGKTGFLVSPRDINKMTEILNVLSKDENLRRRIGKNAKESLEFNFTLENMIKNTENLYVDLINEKTIRYVN